MSKSFDLILWGATGFTGQRVADYLARAAAHTPFRWALAGRNLPKLESLRHNLAARHPTAADLPLLTADSHDPASLATLVQQTRVVISTVGPYALHGTPLVAACVEHGVDYCDLTGEVQWIKQMVDTYHDRATETGARIVHACGFDSVPSDLGAFMLQQHALATYGRPCQEINYYLAGTRGGFSGGTIASLLNVLAAASKDPAIRRAVANPFSLTPENPTGQRVPDQRSARWDADLRRWTGPFFMAAINTRIVRRTNYLLNYAYGRDFRYHESMRFPAGPLGWLSASAFSAGFGAFVGLASVAPTRALLTRFILPAPGQGPSAEAIERGYFKIILIGKLPVTADQPAAQIHGEVVGPSDPGYGETAKMLAEAALCLAFDRAITRTEGGVLTPAAALGNALLQRLRAAGMTFAIT